MSASSITIDTRIVNNPSTAPPNTANYLSLDRSISYQNFLPGSVLRTLSTNTASIQSAPEGLLYIPTLDSSSLCINASAPYVPQNVTRKNNLPSGPTYPLIALAPWVSIPCTQQYLAAARFDTARSFIFFLPNLGSAVPPGANDPAWNLNDDNKWRSDNTYPIYAVSSENGNALMQASQSYSGNLSSVPNAGAISQITDPRNYVKLYATVQLNTSSGLPSLWIFLVVVLAILVVVVGFTSAVMHLLQRRRRESLRRRIAAGEVDLETLGIKRVLVPREILDTMPVRQYEQDDPQTDGATTTTPAATNAEPVKGSFAPARHLDQPTCAICLDDFVPKESQVRQLPCGHIFHPECVDTFLMETSSLCPLCKKTSIPAGYCPEEITNVMVRRERLIRQARVRARRLGMDINPNEVVDRNGNLRMQYRPGRATDVEMGLRQPRAPQPAATTDSSNRDQVTRVAPSPPPTQRDARRRWAARRAEAMLGPNAAPAQVEDGTAHRSRWRAGLRSVFPSGR